MGRGCYFKRCVIIYFVCITRLFASFSNSGNDSHFKTSEAKNKTLSDLLDRYEQQIVPKFKNRQEHKDRLAVSRWFRKKIGYYALANITPPLLAQCRDELATEEWKTGHKRAPATVRRYLMILSHVFTIAVQEWEWMNDNPMRKVRKPEVNNARTRFLSSEELENLLSACRNHSNKDLYPIVFLSIATGCRRSEILKLRWRDVDLNSNPPMIRLEVTKNKEKRSIPVIDDAVALLRARKEIPRIDTDLVFPSSRKSDQPVYIRAAWDEVIEQTSIQNFRFHDLRHTAASYLAMHGATLTELSSILGHKTMQMVKRYSHLTETHTSNIVNRTMSNVLRK